MAYENNNQNLGQEIGWDDEIAEEGQEYVPLPAGTYDFEVLRFERGRFPGSANMCACNKLDLYLSVSGQTIRDTLFMNRKAEWRLSQFLISVGLKQEGVPCRINWNAVPGARGRCELKIRTWQGKDGEDHQSNEVKKYLKLSPDEDGPVPQQFVQQPGYQQPPQPSYQQPSQLAYAQQTMTGYQTRPNQWQAGKF